VAWRGGSIYQAMGTQSLFVASLSMLLVGVLLLGMLRRERHGVANIGFESALLIGFYLAGTVILWLGG
jgi:cation:H+ antiporter